MSFGAVRHNKRKVAAAAARSRAKSGGFWVGAKRIHVEVMIQRDDSWGTPHFKAVACPHSSASITNSMAKRREGSQSGACRGGEGRSPTQAYQRALAALAKIKR